jgi:hypothetical protein
VKAFVWALLLAAAAYSYPASFLLNIGLIPFPLTAVCSFQILIVLGFVAFASKIAAENRGKRKPQDVAGINGSWNDQKNKSAHVLDMVDVGSRRVVDLEIVRKANASECDNSQGSSNGMEMDVQRRMVMRRESSQKATVAVTDQDLRMSKGIRESCWNARHASDVNHVKTGARPLLARASQGGATVAGRAREALYGLG